MKFDSIEKLYNLKNLSRYNMTTRIRNESVAEHSYFTTMMVLLLCNEMNTGEVIKMLALELSLIHDIPEVYTSDIPHPVKANNETLSKELERIEHEIMQWEYPELYSSFSILAKNDVVLSEDEVKAKIIVEMADVLSVIQYTHSEIKLGNTYMNELYENSLRRLEDRQRDFMRVFGKTTNLIY